MKRRALAWGEIAFAFFLLYAGVPWVGLQLDRLFRIPPLPEPIRWIGLPFLIVGAAGLAWCFSLFVRRGRGTPNPMMPPQLLVVEGPFAWTRNPIALSHAAALFGLCLVLGSLSAVILIVVLSIPVHFAMLQEERTLEVRFGDAYRAYKAAVPRWIPRRPRRQS